MRLQSGQDGLEAIKAAGGADRGWFALDSDGVYAAAHGSRIAKTYEQLSGNPRMGRALFVELGRQDWRLPKAGRGFRRGEFHAHLRHLVRGERLHVLERDGLSTEAARALRADVKAALTRVASGREGVASLLHEIERVARYASGKAEVSLGKAADDMRTLVSVFAGSALKNVGLGGMSWDRLYDLVRDARNDIAHTGTEAALAETRTKALAAVLLEALLGAGEEDGMTRLAEVMVAGPVCAHGWQTIADVRRTMLVSDFTALPLAGCETEETWPTVTAESVGAYLGSNKSERKKRMERTVDEAMGEGCRALQLCHAPTAGEDTLVSDIRDEAGKMSSLPIVVTRTAAGSAVLVGIVTAFDLL